jgi:hypothetical protein
MNRAAARQWGIAACLAAAAIAGTWFYSASAHSVRVVEITSIGCGPAAHFGLPLALLGETAAALPVAVGPIVSEDRDRPLRLVFDPALSPPQDRMLRMDGGTLVLPTTYGRTRAEPARIGLNCRDGRVVSVRYSGGGGAATTFTVAGAAQAGRATEN